MATWQRWSFGFLCTLVLADVSMFCQLASAAPAQRFLPDRAKEREGKEFESKIPFIRKMGYNFYSDFQLEVSTPNSPPYLGIVAEPFKATLFSLSLISETTSVDDTWHISVEGPKSQKTFGSQVKLFFNETGAGQLKVFACPQFLVSDYSCPAGSTTVTFTIPVTVVYIRREMSTMSYEDVLKYFSAVKIMKNYATEEGVQIYGPQYISYDDLAAHHAAAVWTQRGECDFGHHGPAFITFHRVFGRLFEKVLQSIDPSLTSPYWDYLGEDPNKTFFFTEKFYGNYSGDPTRQHQVFDGQFPSWTVPSGEKAEILSRKKWGKLGPSLMLNPYGYLRGKDNVNKAPYLTRYGPASGATLPTTDLLALCANYSVLGHFLHCLDTQRIHPVYHSFVGGSYGIPLFSNLVDTLNCSMFDSTGDCETAFSNAIKFGGMYRSMGVLDGCVICENTCTVDEPEEDCGCGCPPADTPWCHPKNAIMRMCHNYGLELPTDIDKKIDFIRIGMCDTSRAAGDYMDAAAAALDPIFWPIHANIDRILSSWRLTKLSPPWTDLGFTYPSKDLAVFPDFRSTTNILEPGSRYVGVTEPGDGNLSGVCEGQGLFDEVALGSFVNVFDSIFKETSHTNLEVLETIDIELTQPWRADYVYDRYVDFSLL